MPKTNIMLYVTMSQLKTNPHPANKAKQNQNQQQQNTDLTICARLAGKPERMPFLIKTKLSGEKIRDGRRTLSGGIGDYRKTCPNGILV